jgi:hypothetical protein
MLMNNNKLQDILSNEDNEVLEVPTPSLKMNMVCI